MEEIIFTKIEEVHHQAVLDHLMSGDFNALYKSACDLIRFGEPVAQAILGFCYCEGWGVDQDRVQGYAWLKLAMNTHRREVVEPYYCLLDADLSDCEKAKGLTQSLLLKTQMERTILEAFGADELMSRLRKSGILET